MKKWPVKYFKDAAGEWRWRFIAKNGEILAVSSEGYKRRKDAAHGVHLMIIAFREAFL